MRKLLADSYLGGLENRDDFEDRLTKDNNLRKQVEARLRAVEISIENQARLKKLRGTKRNDY